MRKKRRVDNYNIVVSICNYFAITEEQFFSKSRKRTFAQARQIAMYIMRHHGRVSTLIGIKDFFQFRNSIRNHATVIHAVRAIETELEYDEDLKEQIDEICEDLCISRRNYIDIYWFMNIEKGKKIHLQYGLEGEKNIIWEHESIEKRGGRIYVKGRYKKGNDWIDRNDMMYEDCGFICAGDGHKVFSTGNKVLL